MMIRRRGGCAGKHRTLYKVMIALIGKRTHALFQIAAKRRRPANAQHLASCADAVVEETLVATPITSNESVVGHSIQEGIVDVPGVLPLGDFVGQIEVVPDPGKI